MAGTRTQSSEPPRSTAYYYADLERIKKKNEEINHPIEESDYVETTEVVNDEPVAEVPPLRDRRYQDRKMEERKLEETYSTAGTFPMPEPKEKEPLLAELEVVGRLPLTQLDSSSGVRRSRSWYLCCPNVGDEEISRESSWRYSSLRPVTAPPIAGQNGLHLIATQSSGADDIITLRNERDALARALAAEKQRAANEARAHDARLAELHGVIAELVRRRAQDKCARAIPEEEQEVSDECESTTQPAGELDNDADRSRTDQNDTSSLSPAELGSPRQEQEQEQELDTDSSTQELPARSEQQHAESAPPTDTGDPSVNYSERDSEICLTTARCCQFARGAHLSESCHVPDGLLPPSPGRCESRQAKLASRVRLRRATDSDSTNQLSNDESGVVGGESRLPGALLPCEDIYHEEASVAGEVGAVGAAAWRARCLRLQADCRVLDCALARALDTAHRLSCACAAQESSMVALCSALRAADRALETYDVLLALAETQPPHPHPHPHPTRHEREAAETVARRLLARLEAAPALGEPLLSPGPWLSPHHHHHHHHHLHTPDEEGEGEDVGGASAGAWSAEQEARLRQHAARLKTDTVALRALPTPPQLFTYHTDDEEGLSKSGVSMAEMEAAVMMQELLSVQETRAAERAAALRTDTTQSGSCRSRRRKERERHWLDTRASETDL
ncbi:PREDICTED: uncharacterized protein LOC106126020 isoform X2 [Papilio xuthus]|uniref:Uncharacterized protein LOC106126020 isoform X2 n=1 Tax=Papilio xuthus TaxID=66420 RepID=A0AAJ7EIR1_PAPXU|nr:PREDICTED: uncharacterized protein LOC106126020 isoform X2 [Papilio xuthus]